MRPLFRAFEACRVRYLVVGGQAAILYGAAHFSQDLDLWIDPAEENIRRIIDALEEVDARVHKLTPPLTSAYVARGHGFHFVIPFRGGPVYLDVMGRPPRVGSFRAAWKRAEIMPTPWGRLRVASIPDLVEMKKTNRPGDYDIITRLALIRAGREERLSRRVLEWTLNHLFRVEDLLEFLKRHGTRLRGRMPVGMGWIRRWAKGSVRGGRPSFAEMDRIAARLAAKARRLQAMGRRYWIPRLEELRTLRSAGGLVPEGTPVRRGLIGMPDRPLGARPHHGGSRRT